MNLCKHCGGKKTKNGMFWDCEYCMSKEEPIKVQDSLGVKK